MEYAVTCTNCGYKDTLPVYDRSYEIECLECGMDLLVPAESELEVEVA